MTERLFRLKATPLEWYRWGGEDGGPVAVVHGVPRAEVRRWLKAIEVNPAPLTWLVAADWVEEYGHEKLAADLRAARTAGEARRLLLDAFFGFTPYQNWNAHHFRHWCDGVTPRQIADWATEQAEHFGTGPVQVVEGPGNPLDVGKEVAEARADFRRFHSIRGPVIGSTSVRRYDRHPVSFMTLKYRTTIPSNLWYMPSLTVDMRFYAGRAVELPDRFVMWPVHPVDVRVHFEQEPYKEEAVADYKELFGDLFVRPAPATRATALHPVYS